MRPRRDLDDMRLARRYGKFISTAAAISGVLYLVALARRSYWALALPMTLLVGAALAVAGVLGGLLATTPDEEPDPE